MRSGSNQTLRRSFIIYEQAFLPDRLWDNLILDFLESLGGVEHLRSAIKKIGPEFVQIDLTLPIRNSAEQEDRFISSRVLRVVGDLGADLAFGFV